ncbi:hypothetical protein ERC79_13640 [Rhodococcus sp. ABRD24]|uniref:DHH family phosphoesterase n=1 Tax=Rhodococcus sp. ABRD24 TaxID=2507582 RepID=UPI0010404A00|nr:DHH family phosphoesterase [Rhodococcus sp. ABRD24]QBJ96876.1 hypothetical protein ERC79_13640 [Rhodococcus sp. ABRD24]
MKIVTTYKNPDLDGVASAIVYSEYLASGDVLPRFAGSLNMETRGVLAELRMSEPGLLEEVNGLRWDDVVLVDCHHRAQLPHVDDLTAVSVVIDHHPDGDASAFPHADIQNELVGAAATLVAERIAARSEAGLEGLTAEHAVLLACAIASNTLDFAAPSVTARDRASFEGLVAASGRGAQVEALTSKMRIWRQTFLSLPTKEAVQQDIKVIDGSFGQIAVSQLEADGASNLLDREDLLENLEQLIEEMDVDASLLSLVDTAMGTTTLVTADPRVRELLMTLSPQVVGTVTLRLPFVALRKTHVIPALTR